MLCEWKVKSTKHGTQPLLAGYILCTSLSCRVLITRRGSLNMDYLYYPWSEVVVASSMCIASSAYYVKAERKCITKTEILLRLENI